MDTYEEKNINKEEIVIQQNRDNLQKAFQKKNIKESENILDQSFEIKNQEEEEEIPVIYDLNDESFEIETNKIQINNF